MAPPPTLQELIDTVRRDAGTEDPISQLAVAAATASDLEQTTDALLGHFVDRCRRDGRSWSEISAALGVTKQAVHKRFAGPLAERLAMSGAPTFERFTQRARSALVAAQAAARASGHRAVGTGHLLLGLYAEPEGVAARVLVAMVSREAVETGLQTWEHVSGPQDLVRPAGEAGRDDPRAPLDQAAEAEVSQAGQSAADPARPGEPKDRLPMTPRARTALINAVAVALEFRHNYVGTEHILLGLYRDPDSPAARVLAENGAAAAEAQVRVTELLRGYTKP